MMFPRHKSERKSKLRSPSGRWAIFAFLFAVLTAGLQAQVISVSPTSLSGFNTIPGTASTPQAFSAGGSGLTAAITINAPTGYEVSFSAASGYQSSLTLPPSSGSVAATTIHVRLTGVNAGAFSGNVTATSPGALPQNVAVSGTVRGVTAAPVRLTGFSTLLGTNSAPQTFKVSGGDLPAPIEITAPAGGADFEVSLSALAGYAPSLTLTPTGGNVSDTTIYVRLTGTTLGAKIGNILVESPPGAVAPYSTQVAVSGGVNSVNITNGDFDTALNFQINPYQITTDPPATPTSYTYGATGLPPGLTVNAETGVISGTPTVVGTFNVVLSVLTNPVAPTAPSLLASKSVTFRVLTVLPPNVTSGDARGEILRPFNYQIAADNAPTSFGASGLPAGLAVDTTTGQITGTPTVAGSFAVNVSATNASGTGNKTVTFNIYPLVAPEITSGDTAGFQGQVFFYAITVSEPSTPITEFRAEGLERIGGLTLNPETGGINGTPENAGTFSVVLSAINAVGIGKKQITITITGASVTLTGEVPGGEPPPTYKLLESVPWSATVTATGGTTLQPYPYIVFATGRDIYNNEVYIPVAQGTVPVLAPDRTFDISPGSWIVPNDGTLFNVERGYTFVVALYESDPTTIDELERPFVQLTGRFKIDVIPNLAVARPTTADPTPGIIYPGPDQKPVFAGGDVAQFQSAWFNSRRGERTDNGRVQSRPLRSGLDRYTVSLRLSGNPAYYTEPLPDGGAPAEPPTGEEDDELPELTDQVKDDFDLMEPILLSGDLGGFTANGTTQIRRVLVTGTPPGTSQYNPLNPSNGALDPYGVEGVLGTERCYDPQPDDGFLDIGERVSMVTEQIIPENYFGRYFVAGRVAMTNPDLDSAPGNNVFVSNSDAKIEIAEKPAPTLEPASAITTDEGEFVDSGFNASDNSSVSDSGEIVAFESSANNLLVPPQKARIFTAVNGVGADMADPALYPAIFGGETVTYPEVAPLITVGRQIFLKYNQTGEIVLASRDVTGQQANANCFNPSINAGLAEPNADGETYSGWYVAYDSKAVNLGHNTGGRSAIYVFNTQTLETVVVSRGPGTGTPGTGSAKLGSLANGDSFRPRLSATGRFVVFQSEATNLDPANPLPANAGMQVYLHDRDADKDGQFDEPGEGRTATYLVSLADDGSGNAVVLNDSALRPVINLDDDADALNASDGRMYVAFTSCAKNAPVNFPYYSVYRASVKVEGDDRGAIASELQNVSTDPSGMAPVANPPNDPTGAVIRPNSDDAAINGDGSVIAFTSAATNLVPDDTNQVPDVFVRDLKLPLSGGRGLVRVSVSDERVATGVINFFSPPRLDVLCNVPDAQPADGDAILISDGISEHCFVFRNTPTAATDVPIGANIQETRDNLIVLINATFADTLFAEATTPPNAPPGLGYYASIYLKNKIPGTSGNAPIVLGKGVPSPVDGTVLSVAVANGDIVAAGDLLLTLEDAGGAPVDVTASVAGTVQGISAAPGDTVVLGQNLLLLATSPEVVSEKPVRSPIDGTVFSVAAVDGDVVAPGDVLLTLEDAFGDRFDVTAPFAGVVGGLSVAPGDPVVEGDELLRLLVPALLADGMQGGGRQAEEGFPSFAPVLGVPSGSGQPSIDREGYRIAFRTIAVNLDVYRADLCEVVPPLAPFPGAVPQEATLITGELIRPLIFPTANVYLHNRRLDPALDPDAPENARTVRASVSKFGYETLIFGSQPTGVNANTSAANHSPAISANGRFISFSSDSTAKGGLIFGPNNLDYPAAPRNVRNVFLQDRRTVGENPPPPTTRPVIELTAPRNGLTVPPGSVIPISVNASATLGKTIESVRLFINGAQYGLPLLQGPYGWSYTLPSDGTYFIRAVATDSRGVSSSAAVTVYAKAPDGEAPSVGLTQPTSQITRFVLGSEFSFNLTATDTDGIEPGTAGFFVNGAPLPGTLEFNDTYVASYRPGSFGDYSISAAATDTDNNTIVSPPTVLSIAAAGNNLPKVRILPLSPDVPLVADGTVTLRAEVQLYGADVAQTIVQFYADGVYVGDGVLQAGTSLYVLNWRMPDEARAFAQVRARVIAPNSATQLVDPNDPDAELQTAINFASIFSDNFLTFDTIDADPLTVEIIKPQDEASVPVGVPVLLEATAQAPDGQGTISQVEFYRNGELITLPAQDGTTGGTGAVTTFPYQINFTPPSPGLYKIVALAYSTAGVIEQSKAVTINAVSGNAPTVEITSPADGLETPIVPINIFWVGSDTDGAVVRTELLVNGLPVYSSDSGSGNFTYTFPSEGLYSLVVRATDNLGNVGDSDTVEVTVGNDFVDPTPRVTLDPRTLVDQGYVIGSILYFNATATARGTNSIETNSVGFTLGSRPPLKGTPSGIRFGTNQVYAAAPQELTSGTPSNVRARAKDTAGNIGISDPQTFYYANSFSPLPSVDMLTRAPGEQEVAGGVVQLRAKAFLPVSRYNSGTSQRDSRVEFYANNAYLGAAEVNTNPATTNSFTHFLNWTAPTNTNSYRINARVVQLNFVSPVVDENGNQIAETPYFGASISPVARIVNLSTNTAPTISITTPSTNNAQFGVGVTNRVGATVTTATNASVQQVQWYVDGLFVTNTTSFPYVFDFAPTNTGLYNLAAVVIDSFGLQGTSGIRTVSVVSGAAPLVSIISPASGSTIAASQPVTLTAQASDPDGNVTGVTFVVNGTPYEAVLSPAGAWTGTFTPTSGGVYSVVAVATDNLGNQTVSSPPSVYTVPSFSGLEVEMLTPQNGSSYVVGSQVLLSATATTVPGTVSSLQFYVNNQPVGPVFTNAPYAFAYTPPALGAYSVFALATDSSGVTLASGASAFSVIDPPPDTGAPTVFLTAPLPATVNPRLVTGARVYLNYTVDTPNPDAIPAEGVKIYVDGAALSGVTKIGPDGDTFAVPWTVGSKSSYTVYATATDSAGTTASSAITTVLTTSPGKPQPVVEMLPYQTLYPELSIGAPVTLRARADFRGNEDPKSVEFYVNGVFVGLGSPGTPSGSYTPYSLEWEPTVASPAANITARATGISARLETGTGEDVVTSDYFGSAISSNGVNPPVTNIPIYGVPDLDTSKQLNGQFIVWMFNQLLYRDPTYPEYAEYLSLLGGNRNGNAPASVKADMVMNLMGYNSTSMLFNPSMEYAQTSAVAFAPFGRLGLVPSSPAVINFISLTEADPSPLPLPGDYGGLPGSPWRATYGMARAMQSTIFDAAAFDEAYQGASGLIGTDFVVWMAGSATAPAMPGVMFPGRVDGANSRTLLADMIDDSPTLVSLDASEILQGAGAAFQSEYVAAALQSRLPGNDPEGLEMIFQRQLQSAALAFQLSRQLQPDGSVLSDGLWNFNNAPLYSKDVVANLLVLNGYAVTAPDPGVSAGRTQTISFKLPKKLFVGRTYNLKGRASSRLPLTFQLSPESASRATLSGNRLTITAPGTVTVTANQAGGAAPLRASQLKKGLPPVIYAPASIPKSSTAIERGR